MEQSDFYGDRKYCDRCGKYVHYLMSVESSYCVDCGTRVHLFSRADWEDFNSTLEERRPRRGRQRNGKDRGRESA
jgi:hypothetical protein